MKDTARKFGWLVNGARVAVLAAGALAVATVAAPAQQPPAKKEQPAKKDTKAKAPAAAKKEGGAVGEKQQTFWVKLCEKSPIVVPDKEGKPMREMRNICLTHHERIDGNSGIVVISAALRQVEGEEKQHLMLMVPLGTALAPGLRATVFNAEQWEKVQKSEKFDDSKLEPIKFAFSFCHQAGCTAEIEATKELIEAFQKGAGIMVLAYNAQRQLVAFPVPLTGFNEALSGEPVDNAKYSEARKAAMLQIAQRQQQLAEEHRKRQEEAAAAAQKGGAPAAPAKAPAPEKKK
jgi:invasion protein IalB